MSAKLLLFKEGVTFTEACLDDCMVRVLRAVLKTAPTMEWNAVVITSATDGRHGERSFHYVGRAFDIRTLGRRPGGIHVSGAAPDIVTSQQREARAWRQRLQDELGQDYDVVAEYNHIHVEWDPD